MDVSESLHHLAEELSIPIIGFADTTAWDSDVIVSKMVPAERRPCSIMPEAKTAVVIAIPVQYGVVQTAPSIYYHELYKTSNALLDNYALRFTLLLDRLDQKRWRYRGTGITASKVL